MKERRGFLEVNFGGELLDMERCGIEESIGILVLEGRWIGEEGHRLGRGRMGCALGGSSVRSVAQLKEECIK